MCKVVGDSDFCEEFGDWDSCKDCRFSIENEDKTLQCPKLGDISDCESCPFGEDGEYSEFCSPHPDASHPCEYADYKEMLLPDIIRCLSKRKNDYERDLDKQELEEERKFYVNEEKAEDRKRLKRANSLINMEINSLRSKLKKLKRLDSALECRHNAVSSVNRIFNSSSSDESSPYISPFTDKIKDAEDRLNILIKERSESTKRARKDLDASKFAKLSPKIESCISDITTNGIPKVYEVLTLTIDGNFIGVSCKVDSILYLAIAKLASSKVSKKALTEQCTYVDFTLDGCNAELLKSFRSRLQRFYTQGLVCYNNEYISREERRLRIRNMEINDIKTKNMLLQSIIKFS